MQEEALQVKFSGLNIDSTTALSATKTPSKPQPQPNNPTQSYIVVQGFPQGRGNGGGGGGNGRGGGGYQGRGQGRGKNWWRNHGNNGQGRGGQGGFSNQPEINNSSTQHSHYYQPSPNYAVSYPYPSLDTSVTCQLCFKSGHTAQTCVTRGNYAYHTQFLPSVTPQFHTHPTTYTNVPTQQHRTPSQYSSAMVPVRSS